MARTDANSASPGETPGRPPPRGRRRNGNGPDGLHPVRVAYRPLDDLVPYARNARTHTPIQLQKLRASLARFGWTTPMLTAGNAMIAGHARLAAAIAMRDAGEPIPNNPDPSRGPTIDLSHLSVADRRAYVVADNRLALDAGWDMELLRAEFDD